MADKRAIMMALKEAMGESGKKISDADRSRVKEMIGGGSGDGTRGIPPEQNYSEEDLMRLLMSAGARSPKKPAGMMSGGKVQGYNDGGAVGKKKPKMGCVMKGRGGKYKGMK